MILALSERSSAIALGRDYSWVALAVRCCVRMGRPRGIVLWSASRCMTKEMMYGHALSLSSQIHVYGTTVHPSQAACVACDCSPPRTLRSYHRFRSVHAKGQVVRECRVSTGDRLGLHAVAGRASLDQSVGVCIVHEVQRRVALVVVRASQRSWQS